MSRFVWISMLAGLLTASGCEQNASDRTRVKVTSDEVGDEAGKAISKAAEYSKQSAEELQKRLETRINGLETEIAKLRLKGRELSGQGKSDWDQMMMELDGKRDAVRAKLAEVGNASAEAWKDIQQGAQSAWDELDKAVREAAQ